MKHSLIIIAAIAFLVPSFLSAQTRELPTAKGSTDGHYWLKLDESRKVVFIDAIKYGIKFFREIGASEAAKEPGAGKLMKEPNSKDTTTFPTKDLVKQIDIVYRDSINIGIPIVFVYEYAVAKLSGESSKNLEQMLGNWKKEQ